MPRRLRRGGSPKNAHAKDPLSGLPESVVKLHKAIAGDECDSDVPNEPDSHELGFGKKLFIVPCIMGAYQGSYRAYFFEQNKSKVTPVIFLNYSETSKSVQGTMEIIEPSYDPKTKVMSTLAKGRNIGDCGQISLNKIIVSEFSVELKTILIRAKIDCNSKMNGIWPVVFRQK